MKNWSNATIEELSLAETANGGKEITNIDDVYIDNNGEWAGRFES